MGTMKRKMRQLSTALLAGLLLASTAPPTAVRADNEETNEKEVYVGTTHIKNPSQPKQWEETWVGEYVYFGKYEGKPVRYRVLAPDTERFGQRTLFLDCETVLYQAPFDIDDIPNEGAKKANEWAYSDIRKGLNGEDFLMKPNGFTDAERSAIIESYAPDLAGDKVFLLSISEMVDPAYGYVVDIGYNSYLPSVKENAFAWWLRSASPEGDNAATRVNSDGGIDYWYERVGMTHGVSPAFNVDLDRVLFSSPIPGTLTDYKLTLIDPKMDLNPPVPQEVQVDGRTVSVECTATGENGTNATRISALITDREMVRGNSNAQILQYTEVVMEGPLYGEANIRRKGSFTLAPEVGGTWGQDFYVYLFAEQINGPYETDYASGPIAICPAAGWTGEALITRPTEAPTEEPTEAPTEELTEEWTEEATEESTEETTEESTEEPTEESTEAPTEEATEAPTEEPTEAFTEEPTEAPTEATTIAPTETPTKPPAATDAAPSEQKSNDNLSALIFWGVIVLAEFVILIAVVKHIRKKRDEDAG